MRYENPMYMAEDAGAADPSPPGACASTIAEIGPERSHGCANGACPAAMESARAADSVCSLRRPGPAAARPIFAQIAGPTCVGAGLGRGSKPLAHNGVVGGSSPPEPTTQSFEPQDFPETAEKPAIGGLLRLRFPLTLAANACGRAGHRCSASRRCAIGRRSCAARECRRSRGPLGSVHRASPRP